VTRLARIRDRYRAAEDPLRTERRIELVLLLLAALLLLQLTWMLIRAAAGSGATAIAPAADSLRVASRMDAGVVGADDSAIVRARPLFWPSRRPIDAIEPEPVVEEALAGGSRPAKRLKEFKVTGVFGGGDTGGAIVIYKGEEMRVAVGDEIDGWELSRVGPGEAVMTSAGEDDVRRLLPEPVLAVAVPAEDVADGVDADAGAAAATEAGAPVTATQQNNNAPGTLSAGGLSLGGPGPTPRRTKR
jgi:hypothetical protein